MADARISELTAGVGSPDAADIIPVVDVSDTADSAQGTTKKWTYTNFVEGLVDKAGDTMTGGLTIESTDSNAVLVLNAGGTSGFMDDRVVFQDDGVPRWGIQYDESAGEFQVQRFNASGVLVDNPIVVFGSNGQVKIADKLAMSTSFTRNYMQSGIETITMVEGIGSSTVTFPEAFDGVAHVFVTNANNSGTTTAYKASTGSQTSGNDVLIRVRPTEGGTLNGTLDVVWIAFGPKLP